MSPLFRAIVFCASIVGMSLILFVSYLHFRSVTPATDASLSRIPDILEEAQRKRARSGEQTKEQEQAASRQCMANGDRYCLMGDYRDALAEYIKAVGLDQENLQAALEVGRVGWHLKDRVSAQKGWQKAITLEPLSIPAHTGLFDVTKEGTEDEARRAFRHAITLRVIAPYHKAAREFIVLNPEFAREIALVADDVDQTPAETDLRALLTKAWQALPKRDSRTADVCFARVLALLKAQDAEKNQNL